MRAKGYFIGSCYKCRYAHTLREELRKLESLSNKDGMLKEKYKEIILEVKEDLGIIPRRSII
jgi:hypothetical protein